MKPQPLPHLLHRVEIVVAAGADVAVGAHHGERRAAALRVGWHLGPRRRHGPHAHRLAAYAAQHLVEAKPLGIGVAAQFFQQRRVDLGDLPGAVAGERQRRRGRPPGRDAETLRAGALGAAQVIM